MSDVLIRWVIGGKEMAPCCLEVLSHSVEQIHKLYPEASLVICYNNLLRKNLRVLRTIAHHHPVTLVDQSRLNLPVTPRKAEWLLWPGRLHIYAHEIMMDNDVILFKRHPLIDEFLGSNDMIFAAQSRYSNYKDNDPKLYYGEYNDIVPNTPPLLNSGLYGVPPYFDLTKFYVDFYAKYGKREYHHTNAQGVVAYLVKTNNHKTIPLKDIPTVGIGRYKKVFANNKLEDLYGLHFVQLNRGFKGAWRMYCHMIGQK